MSDDLKVLREAIAGYQRRKHPRWARLADWASGRLEASAPRALVGAGGQAADTKVWLALEAQHDLLDLPRLFAAIVPAVKSGPAAERVKRLSRWKDPRVVTGVLGLLERPGRSATAALPYFKTCIETLKNSGDVRAREGLTSLSTRYKAIVTSTMGEVVASHCAKAARAMAASNPPTLPEADVKRLDELEQRFEVEKRGTDSKAADDTRAKQRDEALLDAIYASPDDDGPRLVFADALSERVDERGEFITLQVQRAAGQGSLETLAREQVLYRNRLRVAAWNLPLSSGGECFVARGFPSVVRLSARSTRTVIGSPAWATVEGVRLPSGVSAKQLKALVEHPVMFRVRRVAGLDRETLEKLGSAPRPWRDVSMSFTRDQPFSSRALATRFPALTSLSLLVRFAALGGEAFMPFTKLESLALIDSERSVSLDWILNLPPLKRLSVLGPAFQSWPAGLQARHPHLEFLALSAAPPPDRLEGLSTDTLDLGYPDPGALEAVSRVLGRVRVLTLREKVQVRPPRRGHEDRFVVRYDPLLESKTHSRDLIERCLPVWTTSTLERVNLSSHVRLERGSGGWRLGCCFTPHLHAELDRQGLATVPGIERLVVAPMHVSPLHGPNEMPNADELRSLRDAWGSRLELLSSNPWLLEQSLRPVEL
jgi:uncharacterized protein (TIGR02996 family)